MPSSARARGLLRRHSSWLLALVVVCCLGAAALISPGIRQWHEWSSSVEQTRRQVAVLDQRKAELLSQFAVDPKAMLERKAHELGQVKPGEILIQVVPSPTAKTPLAALNKYWYPQRELAPHVPVLVIEKSRESGPQP